MYSHQINRYCAKMIDWFYDKDGHMNIVLDELAEDLGTFMVNFTIPILLL